MLLLPCLTFAQQTFIAKVKITNEKAIKELGSDIVEVKLDDRDMALKPTIGTNLVIKGHALDSKWETEFGILREEFSYTDYIIAIVMGGPPIIEFRPETKWYLRATILSIYSY